MIVDPNHTFITSDHHFKSYDLPLSFMQVFSKDEEDTLIDKWNSVVTLDDIVIYVGDFCDGNVNDLMQYRKWLNGNIVLVKGNHDILPDDVYKAIFNDVYESIYLDNLNISISHYPTTDNTIKYHIHGHTHRNEVLKEISPNNIFCSCVSKHNGYPILLNDILVSEKPRL
jgi:calcineurin-like phosphoesterase family protein